jgi:hypothetical protein
MTSPENKEVIKHAAVQADSGLVFLGKSHADCFHQMRNTGVDLPSGSQNQGFFTSQGRFVNRGEAMRLAFLAGQVGYNDHYLISEMLWSEQDAGQFNYDSIRGYVLKPKEYKNPVCKGSKEFGSACGTCERCLETT